MQYGNRGPAPASSIAVQPIISLNPFVGRISIKARVVDKGEIKTWNKPNNSGKLFSCTLIDDTASIRATFFNDAADQFFSMTREGAVFVFSNGQVKNANRKFSSVNNDYELSFDNQAKVIACHDAANNIPTNRYSFVPIHVLQNKEKDSQVDVLGVVTKVGDVTSIIQKATQQQLAKRTVTIADKNAAVDVTLWAEQAENFAFDIGSVLALKNCRVSDFDNRSLGLNKLSSIDANPNIPDTHALKQWYAATGANDVNTLTTRTRTESNFVTLGRKYFSAIEKEGLGKGEKADYIEVRGMPTHVRTESLFYDACETCNKKVNATSDGLFRCEKCDKTLPAPTQRYMCSVQITDGQQTKWVTLFDEAGAKFWDISAPDLKRRAQADPTMIQTMVKDRLHQPLIFGLRVKEERYTAADGAQSEDRVKLTVSKVIAIDYVQEGKILIDTIAAYGL